MIYTNDFYAQLNKFSDTRQSIRGKFKAFNFKHSSEERYDNIVILRKFIRYLYIIYFLSDKDPKFIEAFTKTILNAK